MLALLRAFLVRDHTAFTSRAPSHVYQCVAQLLLVESHSSIVRFGLPKGGFVCATSAVLCSTVSSGDGVHAAHYSCALQVDAIIAKVHTGVWWKGLLSAPASMVTIVAFAVNSVISSVQ